MEKITGREEESPRRRGVYPNFSTALVSETEEPCESKDHGERETAYGHTGIARAMIPGPPPHTGAIEVVSTGPPGQRPTFGP